MLSEENVDSTSTYRRNRSIHSSYKLLLRLSSDEEFTRAVLDLNVKASYFKEAFVPSFELWKTLSFIGINDCVLLPLRLVIHSLTLLLILLFWTILQWWKEQTINLNADFKISSLASVHTQISTACLKTDLIDPSQSRHLIFNGLLLLYIDDCIRSPELSLGSPRMQVIPVLSEMHSDKIVVFSGIKKAASK